MVVSSISILERLVVLRRKEVGNPRDFFAKSFAEYREGFKLNGTNTSQNIESQSTFHNPERKLCFLGESWIGLERLHRLTSEHSYGLKIVMTDFDAKKYVAFYNQFKVILVEAVEFEKCYASEKTRTQINKSLSKEITFS